jgi:hypothetical protein
MSILHSITSSRAAAAHPTARSTEAAYWPSGTQHTPDDILLQGVSLAAAARDGRTPLVRIAEAHAASGRQPGRQEFVTVLVTRVEYVDQLGILQRPDIWIDAVLSGCEPIACAARIIGRPTTAHRRKARMLSENSPGTHLDAKLPSDVRAGDLIAIPCAGTVPRSQVTAHARQFAPLAEDSPQDADYWGVCGK